MADRRACIVQLNAEASEADVAYSPSAPDFGDEVVAHQGISYLASQRRSLGNI